MTTSFEVTATSVIRRKIETGDRTWFQRKPGRKHRVRPPVEGEIDPSREPLLPPDAMYAVAVRKCAPRVRHRIFGFIPKGRYPHSEEDASRVFEAMARMTNEADPQQVLRVADVIEIASDVLKGGIGD